jgi:hypothetical protein
MSRQQTLWDTAGITSSPELQAGSTPSPSPGGPTTDPSGPVAVPASRSVRRGNRRPKKTGGTSGPLFDALSPSAGLQRSLESRLQAALGVSGSPEYALTWKRWDMPSGPQICALRASARRTSGSGCTGRLSPTNEDAGRMGCPEMAERWARGEAVPFCHQRLRTQALLAGRPTTKSSGGHNGLRTTEGALKEFERKGAGADLPTIAALAGWATPSATAWGDTPETHLARKEAARAAGKSMGLVVSNLDAQARLTSPADSGTPSTSSTAATAKSGVLNPAFSLWLMGLPSAWLTAAPAKASHEVNSCAGSGTP